MAEIEQRKRNFPLHFNG